MHRLIPLLLAVFAFTLIGAGIMFAAGMTGLAQNVATFSWAVLVLAILFSIYKKQAKPKNKERKKQKSS